jgi:hypothetical protein
MITVVALTLSGCAAVDWVKERWPRAHDPVMAEMWVNTRIALDRVRCDQQPTGWLQVSTESQRLWMIADFRNDPQRANLRGLMDHAQKMSEPTVSQRFCELGKKTAESRLSAARTAWEGR